MSFFQGCKCLHWLVLAVLRLVRATKDKDQVNIYIRSARRRIAHVAAARAWSMGVPWAEALRVSLAAVAAGDASVPNPFGKGLGRAEGKSKGKGKRKGKGRR